MDMAASASNINWIAVIVAAISSFLIGGIWYGPMFGKMWMKAFGFSDEDLGKRNVPKTFGLSLLLALVASINLEMFIGPTNDVTFGAMAGFFAGLGWVSTFLGILYLFEMQSLRAFLINAGYCTISLTVMGAILGRW